jgi:DNA-binding IclR family transcriptional regulator
VSIGAANSVRSVERAVDILRCFDRESPILAVTDLQRRLGLSRPTLYRLLETLEGKALIRSFGEPKRFELGHGVVELARSWLGRSDVTTVAQPMLHELWRVTEETVAMFVPTSTHSKICVDEIQSRQALTYTRGAGFSEPMTVGSSGKVMLAFMDRADLDEALADIADAAERTALTSELDGIRRDGACVSTGEIIAGAVAIAAPVFDADGAVAASICVFGPEARLTGDHRANCLEHVREAAEEVSTAMGRRPMRAVE